MAINILDPESTVSLNQKFREKRFKFFSSLLNKIKTNGQLKILDIGGTEIYWERMGYLPADYAEVTLLNLEETPTKLTNYKSIIGNACDLSEFEDGSFDIAFSNSVIEHLFAKENHRKMADEVRRVAKYYYIQTPNRYFPIEPHWLFPFFQFLPFNVKVFLTRNFTLGHIEKTNNKQKAISIVNEIQLLTEKEMKNIFPDGKVYREQFLGIKKSITMYRFPE